MCQVQEVVRCLLNLIFLVKWHQMLYYFLVLDELKNPIRRYHYYLITVRQIEFYDSTYRYILSTEQG